jgi:serine/threonine protein kinase/tetratricopeptide (TPR) repeat protein
MGVVYRARDERLERDVAVKVLPAGVLDETARSRFRREALALSRLNHPHIGMIHDFGSEAGTDFLVMELVRGRTLRDRLREGPLALDEAVGIATSVAQALEEAHEQGVIHRDLKPENVLLTAKGWVKVLDFGLAALRPVAGATVTTETLTAAHTLTGTLPYMAPEQLLGKSARPATDVYALGVLLYELATGTRPFEATVQAALIGEILHKPAPAPSSRRSGLPLWLDRIVLRCLEKDASARFVGAAALAKALGAKDGADGTSGFDRGVGTGLPSTHAARGDSTEESSVLATPPPLSDRLPASPPTPRSGVPVGAASQSVNAEAYDAVLRGRQIIGRRTEESLRRGIGYIRRAIEIDPLYAAGYAALATAYNLMGFYAMASPADCFPRARIAANRAIELDPNWAPGYASLGYATLYYDWDFGAAERHFRRCIDLDPQYSIGPLWYTNLLLFARRFDEASVAIARAQELDPLSSIVTMSYGWASMMTKKDEQAVIEYRKTTDFDPEFHVAHWMASWSLLRLGRHDEAIASAARAIEVSKGLLICYPTLARAYAEAGRRDEARSVLAELEAKAPARYIMPVEVAFAYEALGERETAFGWLERGVAERSHWLAAIHADPRFDSMRADPRLGEFAAKVRLE